MLHNRLGSGGFVVEAVLSVAGLEFAYDPLPSEPDTPVGPLICHFNPWGQLPVLETPDRQVLTETAAILIWLAQKEPTCHAGPHLWIDDQAAFLRWTVFLSVNNYEGILRQSYPDRYVDPEKAPGIDSVALQAAVTSAAKKRVHEAFRLIETQLKPNGNLLGSRLSPADIYLAMLYAWHGPVPDLPHCSALTHRIATHATIAPIWFRNFDRRLDYNWQNSDPVPV